MERLSYKTRENISPQGRPKVYFCAHTDDHARFLGSITKEILAEQNCAVWYLRDPYGEIDKKAHFDDLSQMQLFVMPVTYRLLTTENFALDEEFAFAVRNHIPVLPLMQENGLESLFNEKCGNLQFLNNRLEDATAIAYGDKLREYLSTVLVGDEMANKVREAFRAYVFLSYRKKDRRYAQELMRLIHKNDFCRDVAIWYDEFLVPGEDFNAAIETALTDSNLFAMVVTPNLVNEKNYVQTTEFPKADDMHKPILSVEMVETDRDRLAADFRNHRDVVNGRDEKVLAARLADTFKHISLKERKDSPEHNFFIGLAYLHGIDVEVDYDRALALITGAAEEGLPEAMHRLYVMYKNGIGVVRDYREALFHRENYVKAMTETGDWDEATILRETAATCTEYADLLGDYATAIMGAERLTEQHGRILYVRQLEANGYFDGREMFGDTYYFDEGGYFSFEELLEAYQGIAPPSFDMNEDLRMGAEAYRLLAWLCQRSGDFSNAAGHYGEAIRYMESIPDDCRTTADKAFCASLHMSAADVALPRGWADSAEEHCAQGLALYRESYREERDASYRLSLIEGLQKYIHIAIEQQELGLVERLEPLLEESIGELLEEDELPGSVRSRLLVKQASSLSHRGKVEAAKECYAEAIRLQTVFATETDSPVEKARLADIYEAKANLRDQGQDAKDAMDCYTIALSLREEVESALLTREARMAKAKTNEKIALALLPDYTQREKALAAQRRALRIYEALSSAQPTGDLWAALSGAHERMAVIYGVQGNRIEEEEHVRLAEETLLIWSAVDEGKEGYTALLEFYGRQGDIAEKKGELRRASRIYKKALDYTVAMKKKKMRFKSEIMKLLIEECKNSTLDQETALFTVIKKQAILYGKQKKLRELIAFDKRCQRILDDMNILREPAKAWLWHVLSDVAERRGKQKMARSYIERAAKILEDVPVDRITEDLYEIVQKYQTVQKQ